MNKDEIIQKLSELSGNKYFFRWVDHETTLGDFNGAKNAVDVFNVPSGEARELYSLTFDFRWRLRAETGRNILLITHTPEATEEFYSYLIPDSCSE